MSSIALRIAAAEATLERLRNHANMVDISPGRFPIDSMKKHVSAIEAAISALAADLAPQKSTFSISGLPARHQSIVTALANWARSVGSAIVRFDSARQMVLIHCPDADLPFWTAQRPGLIAGLVGAELKDSEHMKAAGVLAFRADPCDGFLRIVDVNPNPAHADAYRLVTDRWPGGKKCRFCRIAEPPESMELQAVDAEQRNGYNLINGVQQLQPGVVHTHPQCREHWLRTLRIAEQYASLEDAIAADVKAGRVSRGATPTPQTEPEKPRDAPNTAWEPERADQALNPAKGRVRVEDGRG